MRRLAAHVGLALTSTLMLLGNSQAATASRSNGVAFIHDDYAAALQQARASKLPLFAKIWSPW